MNRKMTFLELKDALRSYRDRGLTTIKLNVSRLELEAEYQRLTTAETEGAEPEAVATKETEIVGEILTLAVKKEWFDMIASGEKLEEYREIKPYYQTRFNKPLTHIKFTNGYGKKVPSVTVELLGIGKGIPKPEWSKGEATIEQGTEVFILALGEIVNPEPKKDSDQFNNQIEFTGKQYRITARPDTGWLEELDKNGEPTEDYICVSNSEFKQLKANGQIWEYVNRKECWQPPKKLVEQELVIA